MCGRLSQYTGLHEFVDALSMPNVLVNLVGEQPECYNVAPSTQVTTLRLDGGRAGRPADQMGMEAVLGP